MWVCKADTWERNNVVKGRKEGRRTGGNKWATKGRRKKK